MTGRSGEMIEPAGNEYDDLYRSRADSGGPPWDIGAPQPALAVVLDAEVRGPKVLDVGCGTGDLALALARRDFDVTAVDISAVAIDFAKAKAASEGLTVDFRVLDATRLDRGLGPFDAVLDSGLIHSLDDDEQERYLRRLPLLCNRGATVFVLAVSLDAGQGWGVTAEFLADAFAPPTWVDSTIASIEVAAQMSGTRLSLPGFLLKTRRGAV